MEVLNWETTILVKYSMFIEAEDSASFLFYGIRCLGQKRQKMVVCVLQINGKVCYINLNWGGCVLPII